MRLYFHYCSFGFSNCYILGSDENAEGGVPNASIPREAIVIDPGSMDDKILNYIENREYALRAVLVTHNHETHSHGLRTLKKIYDADIYCVSPVAGEVKTNLLRDRDILTIGGFRIEVITVPGHSMDCAVFRIERLLFTGDVLSAGLVGSTANVYAAANQMNALQSKIFSLPGDYTVLPGHGPPSTLEAEKRYNAGINSFVENMKKRPVFKMGI